MGCLSCRQESARFSIELGESPVKGSTLSFCNAQDLCREVLVNDRNTWVYRKNLNRILEKFGLEGEDSEFFTALSNGQAYRTEALFLSFLIVAQGGFEGKFWSWVEFYDREAKGVLTRTQVSTMLKQLVGVAAKYTPLLRCRSKRNLQVVGTLERNSQVLYSAWKTLFDALELSQEEIELNELLSKCQASAELLNMLSDKGMRTLLRQSKPNSDAQVEFRTRENSNNPSPIVPEVIVRKQSCLASLVSMPSFESTEEPVVIEVRLPDQTIGKFVYYLAEDPFQLAEEFCCQHRMTAHDKGKLFSALSAIRLELQKEL